MATEQQIQQQIRLDLGQHPELRLFRSNTGQAWVGRPERFGRPTTTTVYPGDVVLRNARPFKAGLAKGASDLIGWRTLQTEQGPLAVFSAIEVKSGTGRPTAEQAAWIRCVQQFGGLAGIARSTDDARRILRLD